MNGPEGALEVVGAEDDLGCARLDGVFLASREVFRVQLEDKSGFPLIGDGIISEKPFQFSLEELGGKF